MTVFYPLIFHSPLLSQGETPMVISANSDSINCKPCESAGTPIFQPIGKVCRGERRREGEEWGERRGQGRRASLIVVSLSLFSPPPPPRLTKVLFVHAFSEGALMKSHYFAYVAVSEDTRLGGPGAKYLWWGGGWMGVRKKGRGGGGEGLDRAG